MPEQELAIIGPTELVKPFLALGIQTYETQEPDQARDIMHRLEREQKVGLIFIAESLAEKIMDDIEEIKAKELPAVFIMPEYGSKKKLGLNRLQKTMAKAIGKKL
jgi:vacuolar-type H+-ATPase subunit F/Vma7